MPHSKQQNEQAVGGFSEKPPEFIKMRPAWLTVFIAFNGFALAVVVLVASLAVHFAIISWGSFPPEYSDPCTNPGDESVVDCAAPEPHSPATRSTVQIQLMDDGKIPTGEVVVDPKKNQWINELLDVQRNIVKTQVTDATAREYIEKQMHCADGANSSAECPVTKAEDQEVARVLGDINSNLTGIKELLGSSQRTLVKYPGICRSDGLKWLPSLITFDHNSAVLDERDKTTIEKIAKSIKEEKDNILFVVVEGRADPSGRYLYNKELAERRADAVQNQLRGHSVKATVIAPQGEFVLSDEWLHKKDDERRSVRVGACKKTGNRPEPT